MAYGVGRAIFGELYIVGGESGIISVTANVANVNKSFSGRGR